MPSNTTTPTAILLGGHVPQPAVPQTSSSPSLVSASSSQSSSASSARASSSGSSQHLPLGLFPSSSSSASSPSFSFFSSPLLLRCIGCLFLLLLVVYSWQTFLSSTPTTLPTSLVHSRFVVNEHTAKAILCRQQPDKCVHIVIAANGPYLTPLLACINSIQLNTERPVYFHLLTSSGETQKFVPSLLEITELPVEIAEFNDQRVKPLIRVWEGKHLHVYYNTFNYARYYLPAIFPNVTTMIYLDPDTIVSTDIGELMDKFNNRKDKTKFIGAVPSKTVDSRYSHSCFLVNCDDEEIRSVVKRPEAKFFNAGVFVTDLNRWREEDVTGQLEYWLRGNTQRRLWRWGSQGALVLVFYGKWEDIGREWNERNARKRSDAENSSDGTKIFHFTSNIKPWRNNGGKSLWSIWCKYYPRRSELWFCRDNGSISNLLPSSPIDYSFVRTFGRHL